MIKIIEMECYKNHKNKRDIKRFLFILIIFSNKFYFNEWKNIFARYSSKKNISLEENFAQPLSF